MHSNYSNVLKERTMLSILGSKDIWGYINASLLEVCYQQNKNFHQHKERRLCTELPSSPNIHRYVEFCRNLFLL